jgi:hypothetical protein
MVFVSNTVYYIYTLYCHPELAKDPTLKYALRSFVTQDDKKGMVFVSNIVYYIYTLYCHPELAKDPTLFVI